MTKLTKSQQALLERLPMVHGATIPDGLFVVGPRLNVASNLVRLGLARTVKLGQFRGGYFVLSDAGRALVKDPVALAVPCAACDAPAGSYCQRWLPETHTYRPYHPPYIHRVRYSLPG